MRKINTFFLIMWIFVGVCNAIVCIRGQELHWLTYWICYAMSIICLIKTIM